MMVVAALLMYKYLKSPCCLTEEREMMVVAALMYLKSIDQLCILNHFPFVAVTSHYFFFSLLFYISLSLSLFIIIINQISKYYNHHCRILVGV